MVADTLLAEAVWYYLREVHQDTPDHGWVHRQHFVDWVLDNWEWTCDSGTQLYANEPAGQETVQADLTRLYESQGWKEVEIGPPDRKKGQAVYYRLKRTTKDDLEEMIETVKDVIAEETERLKKLEERLTQERYDKEGWPHVTFSDIKRAEKVAKAKAAREERQKSRGKGKAKKTTDSDSDDSNGDGGGATPRLYSQEQVDALLAKAHEAHRRQETAAVASAATAAAAATAAPAPKRAVKSTAKKPAKKARNDAAPPVDDNPVDDVTMLRTYNRLADHMIEEVVTGRVPKKSNFRSVEDFPLYRITLGDVTIDQMCTYANTGKGGGRFHIARRANGTGYDVCVSK